MDKYKLIRELGLQVFTKPLSSDTMVVSADELADVIEKSKKHVFKYHTMVELIIPEVPKTLEERILQLLNDHHAPSYRVLEEIRKLVEK